ncbi:MAG: peroxiredoxin [Saprospiraceae bacterium]|nr:MAG: peroxiredoxin [Saprospiraceae bacterium]
MVLVGKEAPEFEAKAVVNGTEIIENFKLGDYIGKKYIVLFFYPKDFTFVCPTELFAFQAKLKDFEERDAQLIACSTDTEQSHWAWLHLAKNLGGIQGITYPIVADTNKTISSSYDVLSGEMWLDEDDQLSVEGELVAYRGLFIIDKKGVVRHQLVNDMPLGRSVEEAIRILDAIQFNEKHGEVCPANWHKGEQGMKATHEGVAKYLSK